MSSHVSLRDLLSGDQSKAFDPTQQLKAESFAEADTVVVDVVSHIDSCYGFTVFWAWCRAHSPKLKVLTLCLSDMDEHIYQVLLKHICVTMCREPHDTMHTVAVISEAPGFHQPIYVAAPAGWTPLHFIEEDRRPFTWHTLAINFAFAANEAPHLHNMLGSLVFGNRQFLYLALHIKAPDQQERKAYDSHIFPCAIRGMYSRYLGLNDDIELHAEIFIPLLRLAAQGPLNSGLRGLYVSGSLEWYDAPTVLQFYDVINSQQHFPRLMTLRVNNPDDNQEVDSIAAYQGVPLDETSSGLYHEIVSVQQDITAEDPINQKDMTWRGRCVQRMAYVHQCLGLRMRNVLVYSTLAGIRANSRHPLADSLIQVVPMISEFVGLVDNPYARKATKEEVKKLTDDPHVGPLAVPVHQIPAYADAEQKKEREGAQLGFAEMSQVINAMNLEIVDDMLSIPWAPLVDMLLVQNPLCQSPVHVRRYIERFLATRYARRLLAVPMSD